MAEDRPMVKYGQDELTFSLNDKSDRKTEDWHDDWGGKLIIGGVLYYINGRQRDNTWIAGKLVKAPADKQPSGNSAAPPPQQQKQQNVLADEEIPF